MTKFRNANLRSKLANTAPDTKLVAAIAVPKPNTVNRQGAPAYTLDKWLRLISMLNTLKLENQYYRSETQTMRELKAVVDSCAAENPYLVAQAIVYSRCVGEGMRSINHLAATYLAPYCGGFDWAKRFYSLWNKKTKSGGTIFRPDDMSEIIACFSALNKTKATNSMKKGFANALETLDAYSILKYKSSLVDIINLVHPDPKKSKALVEYKGKMVNVLDAVILGLAVSADTHEVAQSDAGQEVAKAVREGKLSKEAAVDVLKEAKAENWTALLTENKLGTLAALRNIRNILKTVTDSKTIDLLCSVLSNGTLIRNAKIMPYQIDMAGEILLAEFNTGVDSRKVQQALLAGYESALPNLAEMLVGRNLVIIDISGSMNGRRIADPNPDTSKRTNYVTSCMDKAALIGATIAKATLADVIVFGGNAEKRTYNANADVFSIAQGFKGNLGSTNLGAAWKLASDAGVNYDRVFILSDYECNRGNSYEDYTSYVRKCGSPYVYSVDLGAYGTTQHVGDNVRYYYGFGFAMFDDIANVEFNPNYHLDKIKQIVI
jgi:hypothetical protein